MEAPVPAVVTGTGGRDGEERRASWLCATLTRSRDKAAAGSTKSRETAISTTTFARCSQRDAVPSASGRSLARPTSTPARWLRNIAKPPRSRSPGASHGQGCLQARLIFQTGMQRSATVNGSPRTRPQRPRRADCRATAIAPAGPFAATALKELDWVSEGLKRSVTCRERCHYEFRWWYEYSGASRLGSPQRHRAMGSLARTTPVRSPSRYWRGSSDKPNSYNRHPHFAITYNL